MLPTFISAIGRPLPQLPDRTPIAGSFLPLWSGDDLLHIPRSRGPMKSFVSLLRFFLAASVVVCHFWTMMFPGSGPVAVIGFFFVPGFLITFIRVERYCSLRQVPAFIINRALRVFPPFWFAVALALVVAVSFPATQGGTYVISIPKSASDWSANTLIWGLYGPPKK